MYSEVGVFGTTVETKTSAQHIASAPAIRHGEPTFRNTCIRVADVPEQVESGMARDAIIEVALRDRQATRLPQPSAWLVSLDGVGKA